jgi:mannosyltransferase
VHGLAVRRHLGIALPLLVLLGLSAYLRSRALDASLWIDEGISVGIASHPLGDIPGLLRQDGAPPAYYLLLHAWMDLAGTGEVAVRVPSLTFALATVPAALWAGRSLFGPRAGWLSAVLAAVMPFLTTYAQETRMYSLVALLSVLATACFLHVFVYRRRGYLPALAVLLALLLYTHYWALFLAFGLLAMVAALAYGTAGARRTSLVRDAVLGFGPPALAFAPWLPTLAFQLEHTGAPWSNPPPLSALLGALALGLGAGALSLLGGDDEERRARTGLALAAALALGAAWASAQVEPGWATRYLTALVGPLLLLAGATLARLRGVGIVAAAALALIWIVGASTAEKSNVGGVSAAVAPRLEAGDLVVSTQPEQVPVLAHYLPAGLRYATPLGPVEDPRVMDWRAALERLESTRPDGALMPLLDSLPLGASVLLVRPDVGDGARWRAPWTSLVLRRSDEWAKTLAADGRFSPVHGAAVVEPTSRTSVEVTLYEKTG